MDRGAGEGRCNCRLFWMNCFEGRPLQCPVLGRAHRSWFLPKVSANLSSLSLEQNLTSDYRFAVSLRVSNAVPSPYCQNRKNLREYARTLLHVALKAHDLIVIRKRPPVNQGCNIPVLKFVCHEEEQAEPEKVKVVPEGSFSFFTPTLAPSIM